jgi:hypothetical protein
VCRVHHHLTRLDVQAFEHWKAFVMLLCSCDDLYTGATTPPGVDVSTFLSQFLNILAVQLGEVPIDFFTAEDSLSRGGETFLSHALTVREWFESPPTPSCHVMILCRVSISLSCPLDHSLLTTHLYIPTLYTHCVSRVEACKCEVAPVSVLAGQNSPSSHLSRAVQTETCLTHATRLSNCLRLSQKAASVLTQMCRTHSCVCVDCLQNGVGAVTLLHRRRTAQWWLIWRDRPFEMTSMTTCDESDGEPGIERH